MNKNLFKQFGKILLVPTLLITGITACGYNNGARTNTYNNGVTPYTYDGARPYTYNNDMNRNTYNGTRAYNYNGVTPYTYDGTRPYTYNGTNAPYYNNGTVAPYNRNGIGTTRAQQVATRVANAADNVPGVSKATAVVSGNNIVIGIDAARGTNLKSLENTVRNKVSAQERGYVVHVTSDKKLHTRIQSIYTNMTNYNTNTVTPGHPVRDIGSDIGAVIRDIGRTVTAPFR